MISQQRRGTLDDWNDLMRTALTPLPCREGPGAGRGDPAAQRHKRASLQPVRPECQAETQNQAEPGLNHEVHEGHEGEEKGEGVIRMRFIARLRRRAQRHST